MVKLTAHIRQDKHTKISIDTEHPDVVKAVKEYSADPDNIYEVADAHLWFWGLEDTDVIDESYGDFVVEAVFNG